MRNDTPASAFERDLIRLCMTECARVQRDRDACAETVHIVASTLASTIALLNRGDARGSVAVASVIADGLPLMVAKRAASFRETFGAPVSTGRPQ